jgi:hypothetical protein
MAQAKKAEQAKTPEQTTAAPAPGTAMLAALAQQATVPQQQQVLAQVAAQAHLQALPKHLAAKVASTATGGTQAQVPAALAGKVLSMGKPGKPRAPAEQAWYGWLQSTLADKPVPVAEVLAKGASVALGAHTVVAYVKRGWLVAK